MNWWSIKLNIRRKIRHFNMVLSICNSLSESLPSFSCEIRRMRIEGINLIACNRSKGFLAKNIKERNYKKINKQIRKGTVIAKDPEGNILKGVVLC